MSSTVTFFFDLSSPYSYLAATQIEDVIRRGRGELVWTPIVLGALFKETGNSMPAAVAAKGAWMLQDLKLWADYYEVPFKMSPHFPVNAMTAHRLIIAAQQQGAPNVGALVRALFDAIWVHGLDVTQPEVLAELLAEQGLDADELLTAATSQPVKDKLRQNTQQAQDQGAFGAPTFIIGDTLIWGNDRLHFVEAKLLQAQG